MIALLEELRCARECVIDRRAPGRLQRFESISRLRRRHRPRHRQPRQVIERRDKRLVFAQQQLADEPIHGNPRVDDRLTTHAVAGIEQQTETDRNSRVGELRDLLLSAVLENLEVTLVRPVISRPSASVTATVT